MEMPFDGPPCSVASAPRQRLLLWVWVAGTVFLSGLVWWHSRDVSSPSWTIGSATVRKKSLQRDQNSWTSSDAPTGTTFTTVAPPGPPSAADLPSATTVVPAPSADLAHVYPPRAVNNSSIPSHPKITLYISHKTHGGLGNKLQGLAGILALARAAGRHGRIAVSGKQGGPLIWDAYWESDPNLLVRGNPPNGGDETVTRCNLEDLGVLHSKCYRLFFEDPGALIDLRTTKTYHSTPENVRAVLPVFETRYWKAVYEDESLNIDPALKKYLPLDNKDLITYMEIQKILHKPTLRFHQVIIDFLLKHDVAADVDDEYYFDLAFHVRKCVDCDWTKMTKELVQNNVRCVLERYETIHGNENSDSEMVWDDMRVFLTSDSHDVIDWVQEALPSPTIRLIHNIPPRIIHTNKIEFSEAQFDKLALPYLDHYLLSKSRVVGSCWTSFAVTSALIAPKQTLDRFDRIIVTKHWDERWDQDGYCLSLTELTFGTESG